jgi:hypothetical protein
MAKNNNNPTVVRASERATAHAAPKNSELHVVNGRLVGPTLNDPAVKKRLHALKSETRKNPEKARDEYIKRGLITRSGKLTKAYGG